MSGMLPSLLAPCQWRRRILAPVIAAAVLGTTVPCWAQDGVRTTATVAIVEPPSAQIAADFVGKSGVALSVLAPNPRSSSLTLAVATMPSRSSLDAQSKLLTPSADAFRSLIPLGATVSILDSRMLFDFAEIYGEDNVILVLLQYN